MSDVRDLFERLTDVAPRSSASEIMARAERRARHIERRRKRRTFATIGVVALLLIGAVLIAAHAGGDDREARAPIDHRPSTSKPAPGDLYEVDTTVEQLGTNPPVLCLGPQLSSGGSTCGGLPIANWDWAKVAGERTANGITQGDYHLVGTFDGTTFTPTETPTGAHAPKPRESRSRVTPCPAPPGGWTDVNPSRVSQSDFDAFTTVAQNQPDSAGFWIDNTHHVYTVAFTGDLDRHRAQLRALWGGAICVIKHKHSTAELDATAKSLGDDRKQLDLRGVTPDPTDDIVHIDVWAATPAIRQAVDRKYGPGLVDVIGYLTPVASKH